MKKILAIILAMLIMLASVSCVIEDSVSNETELNQANDSEQNQEIEGPSKQEETTNQDVEETTNQDVEETTNQDVEETTNQVVEDTAKHEETTKQEVEETTNQVVEDTAKQEETTNQEVEETTKQDIVFNELVVVDNNDCSIKITAIEEDVLWGFTLKVKLENKSSDKKFMFSVESAAINGVQCDPFFATEVAAGKKANEEIIFSDDIFEEIGITKYSDIELSFRVYDSDNWMADDIVKETIHVYPYGDDKVEKYVRTLQQTDTVVLDNEYATVIVTGYEKDDIWGYCANLFLVNKTDRTLMFSVDDVSVNGYMADPFWAKTVIAGKVAFSSMSWSDSTFKDNDITIVEEIEFTLRIYEDNNWSADDYVNIKVTLKP